MHSRCNLLLLASVSLACLGCDPVESGLSAEIAALEKQVSAWDCVAPPGAGLVMPLHGIHPDDEERILEARARIELRRRAQKLSWNEAAAAFALEQQLFAVEYNFVPEYKRRAHVVVRTASIGESEGTGTPAEQVADLFKLYQEACSKRNSKMAEMSSQRPAVIALMGEKNKAWINPRRRLPCPVSQVQNCIP